MGSSCNETISFLSSKIIHSKTLVLTLSVATTLLLLQVVVLLILKCRRSSQHNMEFTENEEREERFELTEDKDNFLIREECRM
jgi:hypothetical protein